MLQTISNGVPDPRWPGQTRTLLKFRQPDDLFHVMHCEDLLYFVPSRTPRNSWYGVLGTCGLCYMLFNTPSNLLKCKTPWAIPCSLRSDCTYTMPDTEKSLPVIKTHRGIQESGTYRCVFVRPWVRRAGWVRIRCRSWNYQPFDVFLDPTTYQGWDQR